MNKLMTSAIILAIVALFLLYGRGAQAQSVYTSQTETGRILYSGPSTTESLGRCQLWINIDPTRSCTNTQVGVANGIPFRKTWRIFTGSNSGIWTWVPPTQLENGNILTDLDHYLMWRQAPGEEPALYGQVDGRVKRAIFPMLPENFGACFWFVAVRKPATSPAVPSDKSNSICMDALGQPLPSA